MTLLDLLTKEKPYCMPTTCVREMDTNIGTRIKKRALSY